MRCLGCSSLSFCPSTLLLHVISLSFSPPVANWEQQLSFLPFCFLFNLLYLLTQFEIGATQTNYTAMFQKRNAVFVSADWNSRFASFNCPTEQDLISYLLDIFFHTVPFRCSISSPYRSHVRSRRALPRAFLWPGGSSLRVETFHQYSAPYLSRASQGLSSNTICYISFFIILIRQLCTFLGMTDCLLLPECRVTASEPARNAFLELQD